MAKRNENESEKSWLANYNAKAELVKFAASLAKPAYGRITDVPGYENILWGGRTAINLGFNLQKAYMNMVLDFAVHDQKYRPSRTGMGVAAQIEEARGMGLIPEEMRPMTPAHWRAVLANLPLASTEGGVGMSVNGQIGLLAGLSDLDNGRNTADFRALVHHLRKLADISPKFAQYLPAAKIAEDGAQEARSSMYAEMNAAYAAAV
jgi:hypothetical protein